MQPSLWNFFQPQLPTTMATPPEPLPTNIPQTEPTGHPPQIGLTNYNDHLTPGFTPTQSQGIPMSQDTNLTTDTQSQNTTRKPPPNEPIPQQHSQQTQPVLPLRRANDNNPWGDATHLEKPHNHFQLLSKNVGTLNTTSLDMLAIATGLQELHASMFLGQETNTPWNPKNLQNVASQCHQIYTNKKIATSSAKKSAMACTNQAAPSPLHWADGPVE